MHIISSTNFPLFCSNSVQKCLILPAECSPQKSLILLEILPAEFIQGQEPTVPAVFFIEENYSNEDLLAVNKNRHPNLRGCSLRNVKRFAMLAVIV